MFKVLGLTLLVAVAAGFAARGRIGRLADLRFTATPALFAALVLGMLPLYVGIPSGLNRTLVTIANLIVAGWLALNARTHGGVVRVGLAVLALGWLLNAAVIAANGAMPMSRWAYAKSGQTDAVTEGEGGFFKIEVAGPHTALRPLGDVIPIAPMKQVLSIGDLLLMLGIGIVVAGGMRASASQPRL